MVGESLVGNTVVTSIAYVRSPSDGISAAPEVPVFDSVPLDS